MRFPVNRHRVWQLVFDAVLIVVAWRLTFFLRFDKTTPVFYRHLLDWQVVTLVVGIKLATFVLSGFYNRWWRYVSTRDMWGAARGVIIASGADVSRSLRVPAESHVAPAAQHRGVRLPASARIRRRHASARAHADRAPTRRDRRARQGGVDRRRRRRGPADGARDAAQPAARLHADRVRRRRPAQARYAHRRRKGARHDRRPAASSTRQQAGRGVDRDPVGARRGPAAHRRELSRRARPGKDPSGAERADLRRPQPGGADPPRPGGGRARPPAGRRRPRGRVAPT